MFNDSEMLLNSSSSSNAECAHGLARDHRCCVLVDAMRRDVFEEGLAHDHSMHDMYVATVLKNLDQLTDERCSICTNVFNHSAQAQ